MGIHLVAFVAARGFLQVFQVSAPLLWPLNLWLPLARHLPEACAAFYDALVSHAASLRATVRRRRRDSGDALDEYLRSAIMLTLSD
ncbi:uncharacterized protein LOC100303866 [Zea mays]|jgi:hypothetical protein|uniref:DNA topoisomerase 2 n=1 Tax=Zea mays TaxID=4577 RepID=B4FV45_MAIZE|nr:uncharacterized protein LOC100303866 [Zea mays]ACF85988.1 unknown [Zea mays]ACG26319.1 hypothetical protein [Zea mays]ONM12934.1 DNA topoisomerase 2 [Zea mays]|eukprot:NP_001315574.1 uncharacterized LOC100303866 [Zea mays]